MYKYILLLFLFCIAITTALSLPFQASAQYVTPSYGRICGHVFIDSNFDTNLDIGEQGVWNQTITLSDGKVVYTDSLGGYCFPLVLKGPYTVTYASLPAGYQATTPTSRTFTMTKNGEIVNFGIAIPSTPNISPNPPTSTCSGNNIVNSFSFSATGATWYQVYADDRVNPIQSSASTSFTETLPYYYSGTQNYHYTVRAYSFSNPGGSDAYSSATTTAFSMPNCYYNVTGNVYVDANKNGIKDGTEGGYSGATVTITGTSNTQSTTNGSGDYTLSNILGGSHSVTLTLPNGYYFTTPSSVAISLSGNGTVNFGITNSTPSPLCSSSYTNNGTTIPAVWRPSNGTWYLYGVSTTQYGETATDIPVPGDYDGDGTTDFGFFKTQPTQGYTWLIRPSSGASQMLVGFGGPGDIPVPGDYDGDGTTDIAVWRPATGYWYINTSPIQSVWWGQKGDVPVPADYDGDGKTDIAVWRPAEGVWFIHQSANGDRSEQYGEAPTDMPVPGDYDGDGKADLALFKGAAPSGYNWLIRPSSGASQILAGYGGAGDTPTPGDFNGDGTTDIAVWRYSTSRWYIRGINDAGITWGAPTDIPVACSNPTNTFKVSGNVSVDHNRNNSVDAGEPGYSGATVSLSTSPVRTTTTDASGNYTFNNVRPRGLTSYTVTLTVPSNMEVHPAATANVTLGPSKTANFTLVPLYSISGVLFDDKSKDGIKNGVEANMSGNYTVTLAGPVNQTLTATNGVYASTRSLYEGTYTVSYTSSLPAEYKMTYPLNGPPPSFSVTVGRSCSTSGANTASCTTAGFPFTASNIQNLNFGMSNNSPWFQCIGANCRIEDGFANPVPSTAGNSCPVSSGVPGAYAAIQGTSTSTPGILYSGDGSFDFGTGGGQASPNPYNWQVGGITAPYSETFAQQISRTSYSYMTTTLRQSNITPTDIETINGCGGSGNGSLNSCTLPLSIPSGIYHADGDLHLNSHTFSANKSIIILVNGDLFIDGEIHIPIGSSATFSVSGDIQINRAIGVSDVCSQTCNVDGWFSADGSFIVDGYNSCANFATNVATRDKRFNLCGAIVANSGNGSGSVQNERDLCDNDRIAPSFSVTFRPDLLLNAPEFLKYKADVWQEIAP